MRKTFFQLLFATIHFVRYALTPQYRRHLIGSAIGLFTIIALFQIIDVRTLLTTEGFVRRGECGSGWDPLLLTLRNVADVAIFCAYFVIPAALIYAVQRRFARHGQQLTSEAQAKTLLRPSTPLVVSFALFIVLCGFGHLWEATMTKWPAYNAIAAWDIMTAICSWVSVYMLMSEP